MGNAEDREAKKLRKQAERDARKQGRVSISHRKKLEAKRRDEKKDGKDK